ncbi:response regulator [Pedobacter nyackensis]|uniref:response regulator n=1 Tax=Pedobacter nyackensis TaxID=475255 RepID=UPI00292CE170|nr:response regulator [Pedobacter nyackensis]
MTYLFENVSGIFNKLLAKERDPINQARIKMLAYILVLYLLFTGVLIFAYIAGGEMLHLYRVSIVFIATLLLIGTAYFTHAWKIVSHIVIWFLTLAVWTNLSIYVQDINIETLQFIWLSCALSFYMHGLKWGWFYSVINVLPVLIYTAIDNKNYFYIGAGAHEVSQLTYLFVTAYNFSLIIFLQYYFFKVFNKNFITLTQTKNELNDLNNKLKKTLSEVNTLSNSRMEFLSTMSHELRTPLNGVIGISNALLLQNPREDQEENLAVLKFSAENLLLLINDILDFNKFDSDKVELERISFDFVALVKNNCASLKLKAQEKMLDLNLHIDEELCGKHVCSDPTRLTQVLQNLINNAIKFTEKGSVSLHIEINNISEETMRLRFMVADTGIGIEKHRQKSVFEPFVQASASTSRRYGGTGLGLPIVKKVLAMFNSHIELVSTPNLGTKIIFDIDFKYEDHNTCIFPKSINIKHDLAHLKILVTEDNPVNILVIKKTLEQWNIIPTIAENGLMALQKLEQETFDVILMDLYMPEMDGYEAATLIRNLDDTIKANTPIIALTASANNNIAQKIVDAGMNDYLSKPFNPEHLFRKLKNLTDAVER